MISEIYVLRQEEIDEDFYFLINNNTGLNMTIPMDLTSFILFHLNEGNTIYDLEIFFMKYWNSKFKTKENEQFNLNNKTKLSNIIRYSNAIEAALLNKHITKKIVAYLLLNGPEETIILKEIEDIIERSKAELNYRESNFYYGLDKTKDWLQLYCGNVKSSLEYSELDFIHFHYRGLPLQLVPHQYRNYGFFLQKCKNQNLQYLIPILEHQSRISISKEILLKEVISNKHALRYAEEELKNDKELILFSIKKQHHEESYIAFQYAGETLKKDRNFVIKAVSTNGRILEFAQDFRNDREVVYEAVKNDGSAIIFTENTFSKDYDIILASSKTFCLALKYADPSLQDNEELVRTAIQLKGHSIQYASDRLRGKKELALLAVKNNGRAYRYLSKLLQHDKELALESVKTNALSIKHFPKEFKEDYEIAITALQKNGKMLKYLNSFQNNKDLLLLALETNPRAIQFADKKLLKDEEIALKVLNIDIKYFDYLLPYMNESFIRRALVKHKHG